MVKTVVRGDLEQMVGLANLAPQETRDLMENLEVLDLKDLMDPLDLRVQEVRAVFQECPEKLALQDQMDQRDHEVPLEKMALMDTKAKQGMSGQLGPLVHMVNLALKAHQAAQDPLALWVVKETKELTEN